MKHPVLALAFATSLVTGLGAGCSKANDVPALEEEATSTLKFYQPRLDALQSRLGVVLQQSGRVAKNLPGSEEATRALVDARDKLVELDNLRKNVEKTAPALAKENKAQDLAILLENEQHSFDTGVVFIHENLSEVESWLGNALRMQGAAPPPAPVETPATGETPPATGSANPVP
jgi:hypothetical protein